MAQRVQDAGLALGVRTTEEADDTDHTLKFDGLETLGKSASTANLDNVIDTSVVGGELASRLAPVGVGLVVDNVIGTELLQLLGLRFGRGSSNDGRTGGFGELYPARDRCQRIDVNRTSGAYLQCEHANTTSSLHQDSLTRLQWPQTVQGVPASKSGTAESARLEVVEVLGGLDKTVLVENTVLAQSTVNDTTETGLSSGDVDRTVLVTLVEQGSHLVTLLELRDLGSDFNDLTSTVGTWDDREVEGEGVHSLEN